MKEKLLGVGLAGSLLISQACNKSEEKREQVSFSTPVVRLIEPEVALIEPKAEQLFPTVYPEFSEAGLSASQLEYLDTNLTGSKVPTEIINYSDYKIDTNVLTEIYRQVESYANTPGGVFMGSVLVDDKSYDLVAEARGDSSFRTTIFIPDGAPLPNSNEEVLETLKPLAATFIYTDGHLFTYIQTKIKNTEGLSIEQMATYSASVEACQQAFNARLVGTANSSYMDDGLLNIGQEIFCNSLGIAIGSKMLGMDYEQYTDRLKTVQIEGSNLFAVTPEVYGNFSTISPVISK